MPDKVSKVYRGCISLKVTVNSNCLLFAIRSYSNSVTVFHNEELSLYLLLTTDTLFLEEEPRFSALTPA